MVIFIKKIFCLSPLTAFHISSEIRSHGGLLEGAGLHLTTASWLLSKHKVQNPFDFNDPKHSHQWAAWTSRPASSQSEFWLQRGNDLGPPSSQTQARDASGDVLQGQRWVSEHDLLANRADKLPESSSRHIWTVTGNTVPAGTSKRASYWFIV